MLGAIADNQALRMHAPAGPDVNSADILFTLERILEAQTFRSSPQLSSFLHYVVTEELAGHGALIKAYSVAVDALGRPASFDPSKDPVIRVIANRLRKALDAAYGEGGADLPVHIRLVKGSYRPRFEPLEAAAAVEPATPSRLTVHPTPPRDHVTNRCFVTMLVLLVLLALSALYIGWDVFRQINADAGGAELGSWIEIDSAASVAEPRAHGTDA